MEDNAKYTHLCTKYEREYNLTKPFIKEHHFSIKLEGIDESECGEKVFKGIRLPIDKEIEVQSGSLIIERCRNKYSLYEVFDVRQNRLAVNNATDLKIFIESCKHWIERLS